MRLLFFWKISFLTPCQPTMSHAHRRPMLTQGVVSPSLPDTFRSAVSPPHHSANCPSSRRLDNPPTPPYHPPGGALQGGDEGGSVGRLRQAIDRAAAAGLRHRLRYRLRYARGSHCGTARARLIRGCQCVAERRPCPSPLVPRPSSVPRVSTSSPPSSAETAEAGPRSDRDPRTRTTRDP